MKKFSSKTVFGIKEKIKVVFITGDQVDNCFDTKCLVYPIETKNDKEEVADMLISCFEDGDDERISFRIKKVSKRWYSKLGEAEAI